MPRRGALAMILAAGVLAGCESDRQPATTAPSITAQDELAATLPLPGEPSAAIVAANVPHVYMSLQKGGGSVPTSIVFAIDRSRDNSPQNDSAIRITPEDGLCNPQELQRFNFPSDSARRPVFGPEEARRGITARELPNFMAMMVTSEMMRRGMIVEPDESKPQNVCTRKLWERMVVNESTGQG